LLEGFDPGQKGANPVIAAWTIQASVARWRASGRGPVRVMAGACGSQPGGHFRPGRRERGELIRIAGEPGDLLLPELQISLCKSGVVGPARCCLVGHGLLDKSLTSAVAEPDAGLLRQAL
jgi:hypothetical protein